jgi:heat shock protein HtpX
VLPAFGLYTHIQANRRRSAVLIVGLFALFYLMTFGLTALVLSETEDGPRAFGDLLREAAALTLFPGGPVVTVLVGLWVLFALRFNEWLLNLTTGSDPIERADDPELYNLLENLCISRGLATPKLRILETEAPNAFASGIRPDQQTITVTRGLLDALDERELEAVLAHELTHIRNGDVRTMVIAVVIVGIMSYVGEAIFRLFGSRKSDHKKKSSGGGALQALAFACIAAAWIFSIAIRFALSRRREYLADADAVELTRNPDAMISALRKIEGKGELEGVPSAVMELCLDNPRSGFTDLFATHPSVDQRVDALVRYAGGRAADDFVAQMPQQAPAA